ncbi:MAG: HU family DNA-binding protein, partial [Opitutales bacterium]
GLPLRKADEILNRLLRTVRELCENGNTIHWARRGTMGAFRIVDVKERDGINPMTGEKIRIQSGKNSITGERVSGTEADYFCFGASKGFLQRLNAPEPDPAKFSSQTTSTRREKSAQAGAANTEKTKKFCCGCLIGIVIFILLSIWLIQNDGEEAQTATSGTYQTQDEAVAEGGRGDSGRGNGLYELKAVQVFGGKPPKSDGGGRGHETKIYFQSLIDQPVFIYWVNFEGELESWGRLNPKAGREIQTYSGHVWLIADRNKKPLKYFVAERRSGYAAIRPD